MLAHSILIVFVCLLSRRNSDVVVASSRGEHLSRAFSVRPVVPIPVSLGNAVWYNFVFCTLLTNLTLISNLCVIMDRLPPETQEHLKKMSTARLTAKLGRAGYDLDRLEKLDRGEILEALAEAMLVEHAPESATDFVREAQEASQVPLPAEKSSSATSEGGSAAVRLRKLKLEKKRAEREKRQAEKEERKIARKAEERKAAREAEAQRLALKAEHKRLAMEFEVRKAEREQRAREAERDARLKTKQVKLDH